MTHTLIPISRNHKTETTSNVYSVLNNTKCLSCQSALSFPQSGDGVRGYFLRTPPAISKEQMDAEKLSARMRNVHLASRDRFYVISWRQMCAAQDANLRSCQVSNWLYGEYDMATNTSLVFFLYNLLVNVFDCEHFKNIVTSCLS